MAEYSDSTKRHWELQKLIAETTNLTRPLWLQLGTWIALATLGISVTGNIIQYNSAKLEKATVELETARLKFEQTDLDVKLKDKKQLLETVNSELAKQRAVLVRVQAAIASPSVTKNELANLTAELSSSTQALQNVNEGAVKALSISASPLARAREMELKGFQALTERDFEGAEKAFQESENAVNGYHYSYEIARLLRQKRSDTADPSKQKDIIAVILKKYSGGASADQKEKLRAMTQ